MTLRKRIFSTLSILFLFIQVFEAQVTITVPSGNLSSSGMTNAEHRKPLGTYFGYERSAVIYSHTEIGQFGIINSVSFYCDTVDVAGSTPVTLYMKEVSNTSFSAISTVANEENGAQMVYSGTIAASSFVKGQWITMTLSSPFVHTTSNAIELIVETNATGTGNEGSLAKGFYHYATSIDAFQYWSADNAPPTNLGILSKKRPNVQFDLSPVSGCSGIPNGGTTVASVDTTCLAVTLSLSGNTSASGLTYQWEDSLSGGGWANVAGATASVLNTAIGADTWFRCKVTCSSNSSYSIVKQVVARNYLQCYCSANLGGGCGASAIDSVAIETTALANGNTGCSANNYIQYPALGNTCAQLASGTNYNLHTKFSGMVIASVWIDYNQDAQFDSLEWKQITTNAKVDSDYVTILAVPANAKTGLTLMRVRSRVIGSSNDYADGCTNFGSGETEDYFIGINYDVNVAQAVKAEPLISLYPNPVSGSCFISGNFKRGEAVTVSVYSSTGSLVGENRYFYEGAALETNATNLSPGLYFVRVNYEGVYTVKKMVVKP